MHRTAGEKTKESGRNKSKGKKNKMGFRRHNTPLFKSTRYGVEEKEAALKGAKGEWAEGAW